MYEHGGHCLICSTVCPEKTSIDCSGWDWFCGHLRVVVHFCPKHKTGDLRDRLLAISQKDSGAWTSEECKFVSEFKAELDRLETAATLTDKRRSRG